MWTPKKILLVVLGIVAVLIVLSLSSQKQGRCFRVWAASPAIRRSGEVNPTIFYLIHQWSTDWRLAIFGGRPTR